MRIYRWLNRSDYFIKDKNLRITVNPDLLNHINQHNEDFTAYKEQIEFTSDPSIRIDQFKVYLLPGLEDITSMF
jgi:hypothetical protein